MWELCDIESTFQMLYFKDQGDTPGLTAIASLKWYYIFSSIVNLDERPNDSKGKQREHIYVYEAAVLPTT